MFLATAASIVPPLDDRLEDERCGGKKNHSTGYRNVHIVDLVNKGEVPTNGGIDKAGCNEGEAECHLVNVYGYTFHPRSLIAHKVAVVHHAADPLHNDTTDHHKTDELVRAKEVHTSMVHCADDDTQNGTENGKDRPDGLEDNMQPNHFEETENNHAQWEYEDESERHNGAVAVVAKIEVPHYSVAHGILHRSSKRRHTLSAHDLKHVD